MRFKTFLVCMIVFAFTSLLSAQQADAPPKKLSPEASRAYIQIVQRQMTLQREFSELQVNKYMLLAGAEIPVEWRENCIIADGAVACSKPKPTPASLQK